MKDLHLTLNQGTSGHVFAVAAFVLVGIIAFDILYQWSVPNQFGQFQYLELYKRNITQIQRDNPYKLLLPLKPDGPHTDRIRWVSSSLIPAVYLAISIGPYKTHLLITIVLGMVAWCCSYLVLKSLPFSLFFTLMIIINPGMVFAHRYFFFEVVAFMYIYMCLNFFAFCQMLIAPESKTVFYAFLFALSLLLLEIASEISLNYVICITGLCILAFWYYWQSRNINRTILLKRVAVLLGTVFMVTAFYLAIRMQYFSEFVKKGHEEELLFTYPSIVEMVECLISNLVVFIYMSCTAFLPPFLSFPNALTLLGREAIIQHYYGAHQALSEHYFYHNLFFWYQAAGMVFLAYLASLVICFRQARKNNSPVYWIVFGLLAAVFLGNATYYLIKIRPYLSLPILNYKCSVSLFFITVLISYFVWKAEGWFKNKKVYYGLYVLMLVTMTVSSSLRVYYVLKLFRYISSG